jgi:hypothetical protein
MGGIGNSTKAMVLLDLKNNPLGLGSGEGSLQAPFNSAAPKARVFLTNHSREVLRKYVKVPVSFKRGAAQALSADPELRKLYNVATLREAVTDGQDMNVYAQHTKAVIFAPVWNGQRYPIPPAPESGKPKPVQVPEGLWDLLMGNYERMHATLDNGQPDVRVRSEEAMRLAIAQTGKRSPILYVTIDGEREQRDNPFGFIEIERRTEHLEPVDPSSEFLTAMDLVE